MDRRLSVMLGLAMVLAACSEPRQGGGIRVGHPDASPSAVDGGIVDTGIVADGGGSTDSGICPSPTLSICDLKREESTRHPNINQPITLTDVVVTTPVFTMAVDPSGTVTLEGFYVQDPSPPNADGRHAGVAVIYDPALLVGTVPSAGNRVTLVGSYDEFDGLKEVRVTEVVTLGAGTVPAATTISPGLIATAGTEFEAYEGMLLQVENVTVATTDVIAHGQQIFGAFRVDGNLIVSGLIYGHPALVGEPLTSITGVLRLGVFPYDAGESLLTPRSTSDVVSQNPIQIARTIRDIQDPSAPNHPTDVCVRDQNGMSGRCPRADLTSVVVTAVDGYVNSTLRSLWVQDPNVSGGRFAGIKVIYPMGPSYLPAEGHFVDVEGDVVIYFGDAQINSTSISRNGTGFGSIPPTLVTPASLAFDNPSTHIYEGSLVEIRSVGVTTPCFEDSLSRDHGEWVVTGNVRIGSAFPYAYNGDIRPATIMCVDVMGNPTGLCACIPPTRPNDTRTINDVFSSIVGVVDHSNGAYKLQPRRDADLQR